MMTYYDTNENNNFLENEFFIIDSYNLDRINSNLYGYIINNDGIITNENISEDLKLDSQGAYIFVKKDRDEIRIYQDFIGSYGLYIFKKDDYFAISNSFLKLIEFLNENNHDLTLNREFAETFLSIDLCSLSYSETLVNEISLIPRNYILKIDVKSKLLEYEIIDYKENTIFLDTEEGIRLLDEWFYNWINLFKLLEINNQEILIDLNGGIEEFKLIMAIVIASGIDLNRIIINPLNAESNPENLKCALKISKKLGFELDFKESLFEKIYNIDLPLQVYSYTKLGFHKETYYDLDLPKKPVFLISSLGMEGLRDYLDHSVEKMIRIRSHSSKTYFSSFSKSLESNIHRSIEEIQTAFNIVDNTNNELIKSFYRETRSRFLFGKWNVENYLSNRITLTPFLDENLYKFKNIRDGYADNDFIMCMIFTRYCPDILDSRFGEKPNFNEDTTNYVKELNLKYPFKKSFEFDDKEHIIPTKSVLSYKSDLKNPKNQLQKVDIENFLKNIYFSEQFRKSFIRYFHPFAYYNISGSIIRKSNPLDAYSALSVLRVINMIGSDIILDNFSWFKHFLNFNVEEESDSIFNNNLFKYYTAAIYLKNYGNSSNNLSILEISDSDCDILKPLWLKDDEGNGIAIYSKKGQLDLKIKFINKGRFELSFKGLMFRDTHDRKVPIFIDYKNFFVNENPIFKKKINACYDAPYEYIRDVENNEILDIHIEWEPFNSNIFD